MDGFTLGLMTTDLPKPHREQPVTDATWKLLAAAGREAGGTVVFFHPHDIHLVEREVRGYAIDPQYGWESGRWTLPSVIVDNVFLSIARHDKTYAAVKRSLQKSGITLLNPRLPDKWGVWQALLACRPLRPYLPETKLLRRGEEVEDWLERYASVFLKPVRGSGGHGVVQVRADREGGYVLTGSDTVRLSPEELQDEVKERIWQEKHLIQRGLPLLEADRRNIDIRVVLHRDGYGDWQAVATVPRVGQPGQAVTNLAQGGEQRSLSWLRELEADIPSQEEIEEVAILAAEGVTAIRPTLAFLGIDVALDRKGDLWVIDVNPRPGRKVLTLEDRETAFRYLVAWARRLMHR
ncbi:MAG: YheC/YheD family protein [Tumebacillaceae bacterium]